MRDHRAMGADQFTIRPAHTRDAETIARVHVQAWRETYGGLLPGKMLSVLDVGTRTERWAGILTRFDESGEGAVFLADSADGALGFVSVGKQRDQSLHDQGYHGEITAIYVLQSAQRRGIGRALFRAGASWMMRQGFEKAALWVLEENVPARRCYAALGGVPVAERQDVRPEAVLSEVAYGWDTLSTLR